jgi:hypothetical protein
VVGDADAQAVKASPSGGLTANRDCLALREATPGGRALTQGAGWSGTLVVVDEQYVYAVGPQDLGWDAFVLAEDWIRHSDPSETVDDDVREQNLKRKLWLRAEAAARLHPYWDDGELRGGEGDWPRVSALPSGEESPIVFFTWKLDNNGTVIVVSPVRLPWLETDARDAVLIKPDRSPWE